ncbi:46234_t:CDS:2, partial [Gigaspora margarita]
NRSIIVVVIAIETKAKILEKIRDIKLIFKDIVVPTTLYVIELTNDTLLLGTNCGIESLTPYKDVDVYSKDSDTFNKIDHKKKLEKLEKKISIKEKEKTIEKRIKEIVNNNELILHQQAKIQEFLLNKIEIFAQGLENLGCTNTITYSINTVLIKQ